MNAKFGAGLKLFTRNCMEYGPNPDFYNKFHAYWDAAENLDAFRNAVFQDESLKMSQAYAELSKESDDHWYRVREMLGKRVFKTDSDAGSVRVIAGENALILIPNRYGDGITRCAVFEGEDSKNFNSGMMYDTGICLEGEFSISSYDCENIPVKCISGKYAVYNYEGMVAFVEFQ
jgi:hypothetical protein